MRVHSADREAALAGVLQSIIRGFCHEVNNPLTGILGYAQLLRASTEFDEETRQDLDHIDECARRIEELVNLLGRFAGRERLGDGPCRLAEALTDTVHAWAYALHRLGIELQQSVPSQELTLAGPERDVRLMFSLVFAAMVERLPEGGTIRLEGIEAEARLCLRLRGASPREGDAQLRVAAELAAQQGGRLTALPDGVELRLRLKELVPKGDK